MTSPTLQVLNLTKNYGGVQALDDVSVHFEAGRVHCLAGVNGSGKSTLIKIVSGVEKQDAGEVIVEGHRLASNHPRLALQHGINVANYPLVDEDLEITDLPRPVKDLQARCYGLLTTPARLSEVRQERRPNSRYASMEQCSYELRRAEALYRAHRIPYLNSSTKSVEEMATEILQTRQAHPRSGRNHR